MDMTPMTELDAVNVMLISIGQTPVNTLEVSGIKDVEIAKLLLNNANREVHTRPWDWNYDVKYEMSPDGAGHIAVPASAMSIDAYDPNKDIVVRDDAGTLKLFDRKNQTFTIEDNPLLVTVTWVRDFPEIPQYARNYIATRAARRFQAYSVGSQLLYQFTKEDEQTAWAELRKQSSRVKDNNILLEGGFVNQIFWRRRNP